MNIRQIKKRADDLLSDCKPQVIRILIIMLLIGAIPSLLNYNNPLFGIISFILLILLIPFSHGQIVMALKVVRNNKSALNDEDSLVGFKRFKELFVTYLLTGLIVIIVSFVIAFVGLMIFTIIFGASIASASAMFQSVGLNAMSSVDMLLNLGAYAPIIIMCFLLLILLIVIVVVIFSLYLYAVPYLLEQYHMEGFNAIRESFSFIKGNVWNLFKLQLSFVGWIILFAIIEGTLLEVLAFIPILGAVIASLIAGTLAIYVYMPKYIISMAIFFEEIAYYRYNAKQQGEMFDE